MKILQPSDTKDINAIITDAYADNRPLYIESYGTKNHIGRHHHHRDNTAATLKMDQFSGIVDYDPEELILVTKPATPLWEIEDLLAKSGQFLAFDPPYYAKIWNSSQKPSIGGAIFSGFSGSNRLRYGSARD